MRKSKSGSDITVANYGGRRILDPHLSVLQLLERREGNDSLNSSIAESWQAIGMVDFFKRPESSQGVSVLSSSDTSEEEVDQYSSVVPMAFSTSSVPNIQSNFLGEKNDDSDIITMSIADTLIMPKLSIVKEDDEFKVLLIGKFAKNFLDDISRSYRELFKITDLNEAKEQDGIIMIIFDNMASVPQILNELSVYRKSILPICQKGQRQHLTSLLEPYVKTNKIKLLSHPIVMSNHQEVHKLLKYLHFMKKELESDYETDSSFHAFKKRKKITKRRVPVVNIFSSWVFWSISISIGVGIGCMSLFITSKSALKATSIAPVKEAHLITDESDNSLHHAFKLIKFTLKQFNQFVKCFINSQLDYYNWFQKIGDDSMFDNSRIIALDFFIIL